LLTKEDPNVGFRTILVESDDVTLNPVVYYPKSIIGTGKKFHASSGCMGEGNICTSDYMYVESLNEIQLHKYQDKEFISSLDDVFDHNATIGLLPLARFWSFKAYLLLPLQ
jgi:hypothetical protein